MTPDQILAWIQIAQVALQAGIATEQQIAAWFKSVHGTQMTDAEMDTILDGVIADAQKRKALADAEVAAADPSSPTP